MAIVKSLGFTRRQLRSFARVIRSARQASGLTQLEVANAAFEYHRSHCKVSRIERGAMPRVDAHCIERVAAVLNVPRRTLRSIDPRFDQRAAVFRQATEQGFWLNGKHGTSTVL